MMLFIASEGFAVSLRFPRAKIIMQWTVFLAFGVCMLQLDLVVVFLFCFVLIFKNASLETFPASGIPAAAGNNALRS